MTKIITNYSKSKWKLPNLRALLVESKGSSTKEYVLIDTNSNEYLYASTNAEAISVHVDMIGAALYYE